jgi:hypothetical protein
MRWLLGFVGMLLFATGCQVAPTTAPSPSQSADSVVDTPTTDAAPAPAATPKCSLASAAVVKSTLGMGVSEPSESYGASEISCTYLPLDGGLTVLVSFRTDQDADSFARARHEADTTGEPTTDVAGLADEAYMSSTEFGGTVTNTLVARKGSVELKVIAPVSLEKEKAFATKVFSSLA